MLMCVYIFTSFFTILRIQYNYNRYEAGPCSWPCPSQVPSVHCYKLSELFMRWTDKKRPQGKLNKTLSSCRNICITPLTLQQHFHSSLFTPFWQLAWTNWPDHLVCTFQMSTYFIVITMAWIKKCPKCKYGGKWNHSCPQVTNPLCPVHSPQMWSYVTWC